MKFKLLVLTLALFLSSQSQAQNSKTEMMFYNVGLGSIFSGVGALINKKPNEPWHKVLLKGMGQGALGGYLIYQSKNLIGNINDKKSWEYSWYGKIVNSAGTSIVENASSNRNFWEKWHLHIGFNRIEIYTKDKFKVKYKIMPVSFIFTVAGFISPRTKFKPIRSLQTGEIVFLADSSKEPSGGATYANILVVTDDRFDDFTLFTHEIIHIYQYYDYNFVNTYLNNPIRKWRKKSNTFSKINDIFYFDLQGIVLRPLYLLENMNRDCYFDNFFEYEAGFYAKRIFCE